MNTRREGCAVRVEVSEYGPIAEAQVELRPLTVFIGPSNTGKSYLAILIYALHRFFNVRPSSVLATEQEELPIFLRYPHWMIPEDEPDDDMRFAQEFNHWVNQTSESDSPCGEYFPLPEELATLVRPLLQVGRAASNMFRYELGRCFGTTSLDWLKRHGSGTPPSIHVRQAVHSQAGSDLTLSFPFNEVEYDLKDSRSTYASPLEIDDYRITEVHEALRLLPPLPETDYLTDNPSLRSMFRRGLAESVRRTMFAPLDKNAHYLPADRTGVMHAHRVVVASMINAAPTAGLRPGTQLPSMSGVLADFLNQLLLLGRGDFESESDSIPIDFGEALETHLLGGTIQRDQSPITAYPVFSYLPRGWTNTLPLMNSSSMVSELAPIVLYLRNVVQPGEVLIIEEPESHLHPGMQVEFIRQVARAVESGVRIMLTTHSEWVLEELANLVRLSELDERERAGIYESDTALNSSDVGVWLFDQESDLQGSTVKEINLDVEEGAFSSGYEEVARNAYNKWTVISNRIGMRSAE